MGGDTEYIRRFVEAPINLVESLREQNFANIILHISKCATRSTVTLLGVHAVVFKDVSSMTKKKKKERFTNYHQPCAAYRSFFTSIFTIITSLHTILIKSLDSLDNGNHTGHKSVRPLQPQRVYQVMLAMRPIGTPDYIQLKLHQLSLDKNQIIRNWSPIINVISVAYYEESLYAAPTTWLGTIHAIIQRRNDTLLYARKFISGQPNLIHSLGHNLMHVDEHIHIFIEREGNPLSVWRKLKSSYITVLITVRQQKKRTNGKVWQSVVSWVLANDRHADLTFVSIDIFPSIIIIHPR